MKNNTSKSRHSSKIGQIYDKEWIYYGSTLEFNERESVFENLDVKDKLFLDLGAGTLRFSLDAVQRGAKEVVAVEMLRGMLAWGMVKTKYVKGSKERIAIIVADVRHLPFVNNSFDLAVAVELFEHIPVNVELFVKEIHRVLKESGTAAINTWNAIPRRLMGLRRTARKGLEYWVGEFYYRYYYPWEFKQLIRSQKFSKMEILGVHNLHYFFPHFESKRSLDQSKKSMLRAGIFIIGIVFDRVFRKFRPLNQATGQFLLAIAQK